MELNNNPAEIKEKIIDKLQRHFGTDHDTATKSKYIEPPALSSEMFYLNFGSRSTQRISLTLIKKLFICLWNFCLELLCAIIFLTLS